VATRIDPRLLAKLTERLGVTEARVYQLISGTARQLMLDNRLAAIALANADGINVNRFASGADLAEIRGAHSTAAPTTNTVHRRKGDKKRPQKRQQKNTVWVVHGRNAALRDSLFAFLRAIGLTPLEFSKAIHRTKKAAPYIGEILEAAFAGAAAVVVLLTPDDQAWLQSKFRKATDAPYEKKLTGQARPNVLFEAGTAFGSHPRSTVLIEIGNLRPFSDVAGRHAIRLTNDGNSRRELASRLKVAGCNVDISGTDWLTVGNFSSKLT